MSSIIDIRQITINGRKETSNKMDRIKFYPSNDLFCGYNLSQAENILRNFDLSRQSFNYDINDIIEFYNIQKFIDKELFLKTWSSQDIDAFRYIVSEYKKIIAQYFNVCISNSNFTELYSSLDYEYQSDFLELIEKLKIYKKISEDIFTKLLDQPKTNLYVILKFKKVTQYYGKSIRNKLIVDAVYAEILLNKYELKRNEPLDKYFLPVELTNTDKENIICAYIDSENPNLNYLRLIINVQSSSEFAISDRTRLRAKKRAEKEEAKLFKENSGLLTEISVGFLKDQNQPSVEKLVNRHWSFSYSSKWLQENSDYNTLLNNFIYLFGYTDFTMRVTLVHKMSETGVLERFLFTRSKKAYVTSMVFNNKFFLAKMQMSAYYHELLRLNIRLEEAIEWFFRNYLNEEFRIIGFIIQMPSSQSTYFEKCRTILPEMESVLKQYNLWIFEGNIDQELLHMSSNPLVYKDIVSHIKNKYVYGYGKEFTYITDCFFSDQSHLFYIKRLKQNYDNFYDLLIHEDVSLDDYHDYQKQEIQWLIDHSYLSANSNGFIKISDMKQIYILKDLYYNEVLNYWHYTRELQDTISLFNKRDMVEFEDTLFSRPEQDYFNYCLNKSSFNNSLDLRNMYSHGTQPSEKDHKNVHEENYMLFLELFILEIIKINDELCIANSTEYKKNDISTDFE
jgi:hypothetical protein